MILAGIVIGGFIGSLLPNTFLNYGQTFGMQTPLILDLGVMVLTIGLSIKITLASILGVIIGIVIYRCL